MIGSTISRTVEKEQQKKAQAPAHHRVAVTNVNLGVEYMRQGYYEKALDKLNRAVDADPDYALAYNALGVLYQLLNDPLTAETNFKKSLKIDKNNSPALNNYGQFLCKQDRYEEAEEYFLAAANNPLYSTPEIAYANAGSCAYLNGYTDVAVGYFEKSLSNNPAIPLALSQMAQIRFDAGEYAMADDFLDRYLMISRHTARSLWLGIRIQRQLGDLDKLASYSLLLRNKFPGTDEVKLFNDSEAYAARSKLKKSLVESGRGISEKNKLNKVVSVENTAVSSEASGLLVDAGLSFYPMLLEGSELLGID